MQCNTFSSGTRFQDLETGDTDTAGSTAIPCKDLGVFAGLGAGGPLPQSAQTADWLGLLFIGTLLEGNEVPWRLVPSHKSADWVHLSIEKKEMEDATLVCLVRVRSR